MPYREKRKERRERRKKRVYIYNNYNNYFLYYLLYIFNRLRQRIIACNNSAIIAIIGSENEKQRADHKEKEMQTVLDTIGGQDEQEAWT